MPSWFWPAFAAFIVIDVVITALILRRVAAGGLRLGGVDFARLRPLSDAMHQRVGSYLRANYNGQPDHLPQVLDTLLPELRTMLREQGLEVDDDTLKAALVVSAATHGLVNPRQLREALSKVA